MSKKELPKRLMVKVQVKEAKGKVYFVTIPKVFAEQYLEVKEGDYLFVERIEHKGRKAIAYYPP